jgi:hypothetical protein
VPLLRNGTLIGTPPNLVLALNGEKYTILKLHFYNGLCVWFSVMLPRLYLTRIVFKIDQKNFLAGKEEIRTSRKPVQYPIKKKLFFIFVATALA